MKKVNRNEVLDFVTYGETRKELRGKVLEEKAKRRLHLGQHLTFLFENTDTIRYQIQEMVRIERLVKEEAICHEISTYNALLGDKGELGCTLLIEYDNPNERDIQLKKLKDLPQYIYLLMENGGKAMAEYDAKQVGENKLSSVQFLKFKCPSPPIGIGSTHPDLQLESEIPMHQREVLKHDLLD